MPQTEPSTGSTLAREAASSKRDYHAPVLQELGKVAEVTATGETSFNPYADGVTGYS
jgi:hypothetical protein